MSGGASAATPGPERETGQTNPATDTEPTADPSTGVPPPRQPQSHPPTGATHRDFLITSTERDAAEARLHAAFADDVLGFDEFGDRMRLVLAARTRGELHAALADLPTVPGPQRGTAGRPRGQPARTGGSAIAIMSRVETRGRWRPADSTTALAVMGDALIDLQGVEFQGDVLVINAISVMGDVEIVVPEGVAVDLRGLSVMGSRTVEIDGDVAPDAPVVRVDGVAVMGDVTVRHPRASERLSSQDGRGSFADRVPLRAADPAAVRRERGQAWRTSARRWLAGLLVAAAFAVSVGWAVTADDVASAAFGSTTETVSAAQLEAGDTSVGTLVAFGSVEIRVPEGVTVERDGVVVFGSTDCAPCGAAAPADAPTVQVRTIGAFGSVDVVRIPSAGSG
ncbi:MAG TPA: DUF1707 domain-containing protein [Euzebyales bacterium]